MRMVPRRKKLLTAAVMAALLGVPHYGHAFKMAPEYVYYNGKTIAEMQFLTEGEEIKNVVDKAGYTLSPTLIEPVKTSTAYWTDMLAPKAKNTQPWQIFVTTEKNLQNASASTNSFVPDPKKPGDVKPTEINMVALQLQDGKKLIPIKTGDEETVGDYGVSEINIGQYFGGNREGAVEGWWVDADTVLPTNEQSTDFVGTFRHELGHALGIAKSVEFLDEKGDVYTPESEDDIKTSKATGEVGMRFATEVTDPRSWNMHLVDQNLNPAKPGMEILSAKGFAEKKKGNPNLKESDFFIANNGTKGEEIGGKKGKAFFVGKNVTDALAGATFFGVSGVPVNTWEKNNTAFEGSHLQTSGMMSHRDYSNYTAFMEVELAVMQDLGYDIDREAYFGHSVYADGKTLTNTQGYFARNSEGTAYVDGKPSQVPLGIGLHIYGSRNTVTQGADILTEGKGATGVRVDGMQNTLVVPKKTKIRADGLRGNGILIAYGRDQVVDQAGTVTANGKGGTGIRFDFGSSSNGALDEYRGSYIRFERKVEEGKGTITGQNNLDLTDMKDTDFNAGKDELEGPLVKAYNLTGKLSGTENAIYVGKNAFVKDININQGASISGNITSDWKHFKTDGSYDGSSTTSKERTPEFGDWLEKKYPEIDLLEFVEWPKEKTQKYRDEWEKDPEVTVKTITTTKPGLLIQYNGKTGSDGYAYDAYIPDLVTNLNFNADIVYSGNITGPDNMKLNVTGGTLAYTGKADVTGVHVAEGATLLGGTYTVHDMSGSVAKDFASKLTERDKGNFINCGTIGPADKDSSMTINGNLISDGTLQAIAGGSAGDIKVTGTAEIGGSDVVVADAMPEETYTVLTAGSITGDTKTPAGETYTLSGMMSAKNEIAGNALKVTTETANNLEGAGSVENETLEAMGSMYRNLKNNGDGRVSEMKPLFAMDSAGAKKALAAIASNASAKSMALAQRSTLIQHLVSQRLNDVFRTGGAPSKDGALTKKAEVEIPVQHLDDSDDKGVPVAVTAVEPAENDIWMKFGKNWGDMREGTDYHSSTTLLGWDKAYGNNWRAGVFAGYGKTGFADDTAGNELKDVRFGLYGGYSKGHSEGMVYLDYGVMRNKLRRGVMGMTARAKYHSRILELGGEYLYDLQAEKNAAWHVRPYVNAQLSRLWQKGYSEEGAGVFSQAVNGKNNDYFGAGLGVEFKRYLSGGSYALRAGVKHAFAGAEPKLRYSYMGDEANSYDMRNVQDRTHFLLSVGGDVEVARGWTIGGDAAFQRGRHDKDWSCSLTVRRTW